MLTLRHLFEVIGGIQATLDMAGAWETNGLGLAPFQVRRSEMRFGLPGIEKNRIVDCSGAAWLAMYKRLHVDLRKLVSTAYTIGVYAPESSDAFEVLLVHDFPRWIEPYLLLSRTKTGAHLSVGYTCPEPADLDESFVAAVTRAQMEPSAVERLIPSIERLLDQGGVKLLQWGASEEDRRKTFRLAHRTIERQLGSAAGTVLKSGGRSVWWRRGVGSVALWEVRRAGLFDLHLGCWPDAARPVDKVPASKSLE